MKQACRRTIRNVVILLIAGATLNVAVAWGLCIAMSKPGGVYLIHGSRPPIILEPDLRGLMIGYRDQRFFGFPYFSLQQRNSSLNEATHAGRRFSWNGGLRIDQPRWLIGQRSPGLAVRPLWPGFAINTVFYAGVLWMLFCGPFALRRMIRRRRGQCAHCAYPIGQNERCTECGAALRLRS